MARPMNVDSLATTGSPDSRIRRFSREYESGVCSIGPEEIALLPAGRPRGRGRDGWRLAGADRRRRAAALRLVLFIPAATAASGHLQARLKKSCAGLGWLGVTTSASGHGRRRGGRGGSICGPPAGEPDRPASGLIGRCGRRRRPPADLTSAPAGQARGRPTIRRGDCRPSGRSARRGHPLRGPGDPDPDR